MTTIEPGMLLGQRYRIGTLIASGGMGDVWEADDEVLGRPVAVKVLRPPSPDDGAFAARFRDEARLSAALHHPNIAAVHDYGEQDDIAYLVMERVPGAPLSQLIRDEAPLHPERTEAILAQAALALAAAHDAGVVHRDVKPANIIVTPEGTAKLTDFGISRAGEGAGLTVTGEVLGTPDYLSPEQALGQPATAASDLYALGVVAHEMLTGTRPFDRGTPVATALAQVTDAPPPLPDTVPLDLRSVIEACLDKSPQARPDDALVLARLAGPPVGTAGRTSGGALSAMPYAAGPAQASRAAGDHAASPPTRAATASGRPTASRSAGPAGAGAHGGSSAPTATRVTRLSLRDRGGRHTPRARQLLRASLVVPLLLLLVGGGYLLGTRTGATATHEPSTSGGPQVSAPATSTAPGASGAPTPSAVPAAQAPSPSATAGGLAAAGEQAAASTGGTGGATSGDTTARRTPAGPAATAATKPGPTRGGQVGNQGNGRVGRGEATPPGQVKGTGPAKPGKGKPGKVKQ